MKTKLILFFIALGIGQIQAQRDSLVTLDVVVLNDVKLKQFSAGQKVDYLADSIAKQQQSFTDLLNFNSLIYFKENGYGMVSSPSFRGTTASQTAVIWNGININSSLNGQTDFNTLSTNNFSSIAIKSGGGGVQYGSGAIGGSIHLGNDFHFRKNNVHQLSLDYGSFSTLNANYIGEISNDKTSLSFGFQYKDSENDYEYLGTDQVNENGAYQFGGFNFNSGVFLSDDLVLKLYHNSEFSDRNLSGSLTYSAKDAYENENIKTMLQLDVLNKKITSNFRVAHLYELYRYFPDGNKEDSYSTGKANTFLAKYDALYKIKPQDILLKVILEYKSISGDGTNIASNQQNIFSAVFLLNQKIKEKFEYGINLRTEYNNQFNVPFIFSFDGRYHLDKNASLRFSASKNYRTPTFNDLYWNPGGNSDLNPEHSNQVELGFDFDLKKHQFGITGYYIKSKDLIKWVPQTNTIWSPVNIAETENYGFEFDYQGEIQYGNHRWIPQFGYGYTVARDLENDMQLIYVPKHKVTTGLAYGIYNWTMQYQFIYNGEVFTTTDNSQSLDAYDISNLRVNYRWEMTEKVVTNVQFSVNNIFNEIYQNVAFRPMPNRNYNFKLILNI